MKRTVSFTSQVERLEPTFFGRMHAITAPDVVIGDLGLETHYRVIAEIGGTKFKRAIQAPKNSQPNLIIGLDYLREVGLRKGSPVELTVWADPDPEAVEWRTNCAKLSPKDDTARERWETFTPGKRRSINHSVTSAKRTETRIRRATEIAEMIRTRTLLGN